MSLQGARSGGWRPSGAGRFARRARPARSAAGPSGLFSADLALRRRASDPPIAPDFQGDSRSDLPTDAACGPNAGRRRFCAP